MAFLEHLAQYYFYSRHPPWKNTMKQEHKIDQNQKSATPSLFFKERNLDRKEIKKNKTKRTEKN